MSPVRRPLLAFSLALAACEGDPGGAPPPAAPSSALRQRLVGTFAMEAGPGHAEKIREQLSAAGVGPTALDAEVARVLALLAKTTLEISASTITTRQGGVVVGVDRYTVRRDGGGELVVAIAGAPPGHDEQRFSERADGALIVSAPDLGSVVLRRTTAAPPGSPGAR